MIPHDPIAWELSEWVLRVSLFIMLVVGIRTLMWLFTMKEEDEE